MKLNKNIVVKIVIVTAITLVCSIFFLSLRTPNEVEVEVALKSLPSLAGFPMVEMTTTGFDKKNLGFIGRLKYFADGMFRSKEIRVVTGFPERCERYVFSSNGNNIVFELQISRSNVYSIRITAPERLAATAKKSRAELDLRFSRISTEITLKENGGKELQ